MGDDWARPVVHSELLPPEGAAGMAASPDRPDRLRPPRPGAVDPRDAGARAESGGTVADPPFDVPNGPTICPILDPEGNRLTLVQQ